jgi:3-methyladenine DNA glycosylase/8-oxoguanine DNA glycosylase
VRNVVLFGVSETVDIDNHKCHVAAVKLGRLSHVAEEVALGIGPVMAKVQADVRHKFSLQRISV